MKNNRLKKYLLSATALVAITSFIPMAHATELTGGSRAGADALITGNPITDTTATGAFGILDGNGGATITSITVGDDNNVQNTSTVIIVDSDNTVQDTVTVSGDVSLVQDTTTPGNTDILNIEIGASDDAALTDIFSVGVDFDGNLNAGANGAINITTRNAANADDITFSGSTIDLGSGSISLSNAADRVIFDGASAQVFSGGIDGSAGAAGQVEVNTAAGVSFRNDLGSVNGLSSFTISTGNLAIFDDGLDALNSLTVNSAAFDNSGTLQLNDGITFTAGDTVDLGGDASSTLIVGAGFGDGSTVITGGTATVNATNAVTVNIQNLDAGTISLIDDNGGGSAVAAQFNVSGSSLLSYNVTDNVNEVVITATAQSAANIANSLSVSADDAATLVQATSITNGNVTGALATATTFADPLNPTAAELAAVDAAFEQLVSDPSGTGAGIAYAATSSAGAASDNINDRLKELRSDDKSNGVSAGNGSADNNFWVRGGAFDINQSARDGVAGYESSGYSLSVGADMPLDNDVTAGVSFTYGASDVDGDSAANSASDISSYQLSLYGQKQMGRDYLAGSIGYGYVDGDVATNVLGLGRASGGFDTNMYSANAEYGRAIPLSNTLNFVPRAGFEFAMLEGTSYTVSSGLGSVRDSFEDKTVFNAKVGAALQASYALETGHFNPSVYADLKYDLANDEAETTRSFGTVSLSDTAPDVAQEALSFGFNLPYTMEDGMTQLSFGYDAEAKEDYFGHEANVRMKVKF